MEDRNERAMSARPMWVARVAKLIFYSIFLSSSKQFLCWPSHKFNGIFTLYINGPQYIGMSNFCVNVFARYFFFLLHPLLFRMHLLHRSWINNKGPHWKDNHYYYFFLLLKIATKMTTYIEFEMQVFSVFKTRMTNDANENINGRQNQSYPKEKLSSLDIFLRLATEKQHREKRRRE